MWTDQVKKINKEQCPVERFSATNGNTPLLCLSSTFALTLSSAQKLEQERSGEMALPQHKVDFSQKDEGNNNQDCPVNNLCTCGRDLRAAVLRLVYGIPTELYSDIQML